MLNVKEASELYKRQYNAMFNCRQEIIEMLQGKLPQSEIRIIEEKLKHLTLSVVELPQLEYTARTSKTQFRQYYIHSSLPKGVIVYVTGYSDNSKTFAVCAAVSENDRSLRLPRWDQTFRFDELIIHEIKKQTA